MNRNIIIRFIAQDMLHDPDTFTQVIQVIFHDGKFKFTDIASIDNKTRDFSHDHFSLETNSTISMIECRIHHSRPSFSASAPFLPSDLFTSSTQFSRYSLESFTSKATGTSDSIFPLRHFQISHRALESIRINQRRKLFLSIIFTQKRFELTCLFSSSIRGSCER